jgi:hypothetical protein
LFRPLPSIVRLVFDTPHWRIVAMRQCAALPDALILIDKNQPAIPGELQIIQLPQVI